MFFISETFSVWCTTCPLARAAAESWKLTNFPVRLQLWENDEEDIVSVGAGISVHESDCGTLILL